MKILVRPPSDIFDAILAEPVLNSLKENFSDSELWLLGPEKSANLYAGNYAFAGEIRIPKEENIKEVKDTLRQIRQAKFALGIILDGLFFTTFLFYSTGIPERWGFAREGNRFFLTKAVKLDSGQAGLRHRHEDFINFINEAGIKASRQEPHLVTTKEEQLEASRLISRSRPDYKSHLVVISIDSCRGPAGRWPLESIVQTANLFATKSQFDVLIIGTEEDDELVSKIKPLISNSNKSISIHLLRKSDLRQLMALLSLANLVIACDSDSLHLANALGRPVVAIFGPTSPARRGPVRQPAAVMFKPAPCHPCYYTECPYDHRCLAAITPDEVFQAGERLL